MIYGNNIGDQETKLGENVFQTINPLLNTFNTHSFVEATSEEIHLACSMAHAVFHEYASTSYASRSLFLHRIASLLADEKEEILASYCMESGLPISRGETELHRTIVQLLNFSELLKSEDELGVYEESDLNRSPFPKPSLRNIKRPIGPIAVFGASNFPLAYSTIGGDSVAALAAGCPIIVKSHPYHAGTSYLVAQLVIRAIKESGMPLGIFAHLNGFEHKIGAQLAVHPYVKGIGFTGSRKGGLALIDYVQQRHIPIPVFAEMSCVNPIIIYPSYLSNNELGILADTIANSICGGAGQFCTKPGVLFMIEDAISASFVMHLQNAVQTHPSNVMLHPQIYNQYEHDCKLASNQEGVLKLTIDRPITLNNQGNPHLNIVSGKDFLINQVLQKEVFGPYSLIVLCASDAELDSIVVSLDGQLTFSVFSELPLIELEVYDLLLDKAGRIIYNGVPTGVEVSSAMQHGGPFPSSSDSRFTAVGTNSIDRFRRSVCLQGL